MSGAAEGPGWWRAADDKWYPPDAHPDEAYRQQWADAPTDVPAEPPADATTSLAPPSSPPEGASPPVPPTPATPAAPPAAPPPRDPPRPPATSEPASDPGSTPRKRRPVVGIAIGVAVVVLVAVIGVVIISHGSTPADAVTLEPVGAAGDDPFTTAVTVHEVSAFPSDIAKVAGTTPGSTASSGTGVVFTGTSVGLYGGTQDQHACDAKQLKDFLAQNPDKASAWAGVEGIKADGIASFVDSLTPVVLTRDTWVTNHGFRDGKATSLQSVLQAGTAVMVDSTGLPRVKCNCGNPLLAPNSSNGTLTNTRGTPWPGFTVTVVVTVQPGPTVTTLQLVDVTTGQIIEQPVGSAPGVAVALVSSGEFGGGGQILVNPGGVNGPTWDRDPIDGSHLTDLAYGNGYFLAVGPGRMLRGDATGHGWTEVTSPGLIAVAYGNGKWIGTSEGNQQGTSPPAVFESPDGTTWTKHDAALPTPTSGTFESIAFGDGKWAAVLGQSGDNGATQRVYTSSDGTTWKPASAALPQTFSTDLAHGDKGWLGLGAAGPRIDQAHGVALTSLDGSSWTQSATNPADLDAGAPVFTDGRWFAARHPAFDPTVQGLQPTPSGFDLLSSVDGLSWTQVGRIPYTTPSGSASGVTVASIAVGGSASVTAPSAPTPTAAPGTTASASSGTTVAIADPGTGGGSILLSPSGVSGPWATAYTAPSTSGLSGVGFGNGSFVAVGTGSCQSSHCNSAVLKASASGRDWTQAAIIPDQIDDVAYGNGKWLAVGVGTGSGVGPNSGAVAYQSTDATTWTKLTLPPNDSAYSPEFVALTSVAFGDGRWIAEAVTGNGNESSTQLLASTDGTTWSPVGEATSGFASVAHGDRGWLSIGASSSFDPGASQQAHLGGAQVSTDGSSWRSSPTTPTDLAAYSPVFVGGRWYVTRHDNGRSIANGVDLLSSTDGIVGAGGEHPDPGRVHGTRLGGAVGRRHGHGRLIAPGRIRGAHTR